MAALCTMRQMSTLVDECLESWNRQAKIVENLAGTIDEQRSAFVPAPGESSIAWHLSHIHEVRGYWLSALAPDFDPELTTLFDSGTYQWGKTLPLDEAKSALSKSATQIHDLMSQRLNGDCAPAGGYDHPLYFMQHMIWHEGWHVGAIMMALRQNGQETTDAWEESNIWGLWRTE